MQPEGSLPHLQVPATCPNLNLINPVHASTSHYLKIYLSMILQSMPGSFRLSFSIRLLSPFLIRATCPAHLFHLDLITRTILDEECRSLSSSLCSVLYSPVTSSLLGPNILLSTLFSNTLSLLSSLHVSDQVSHPYKTTGKIIVLYSLIFVFLDTKLQDKKFCTE